MTPFRAPTPGILAAVSLSGALLLVSCTAEDSDPFAVQSVAIALNATYTAEAAASSMRAEVDRARAYVIRPATGDTIAEGIQDVEPDQESVEFVLDVVLETREEQLTVGVEQLVGPLVAFGGEASLLVDGRQPVNQSPPIEIGPIAPALTLGAETVAFATLLGGNPSPRTVEIVNTGGDTLSWSASADEPWVVLAETSGKVLAGDTATLTLSANSTNLAEGKYTAVVHVEASETLDAPQDIAVTLDVTAPTGTVAALTVLGAGGGSGTVVSTPAGIDCVITAGAGTGTCAFGGFSAGAGVTLAATADPGSTFQGWLGDCTGSGACAVTMDQSRTVTATFAAPGPSIGLGPVGLLFTTLVTTSPPQPQLVFVSNTGSSPLNWRASNANAWLDVNPKTGTLAPGQVDTILATVTSDTLKIGSYTDAIVVSDPSASNSPQTVPVLLNVAQGPLLDVSPPTLAFSALETTDPASQSVTIKNTGAAQLDWSATTGSAWLSLSQTSASVQSGDSSVVSVIVTSSALPPGLYTDTITVSDPLAANGPQQVVVTLDVRQLPAIGLSSSTLAFSTLEGTNPAPQTFVVRNIGGDTLRWSSSQMSTWLTLTPASASVPAGDSVVVTASVAAAALVIGAYVDTVTVSDPVASNSPLTLAVRLDVGQGPLIGISPASLAYSTFQGSSPAPQTFKVTNTGGDVLDWGAATTAPWLTLSPASGSLASGDSAFVTVTVASSALVAGSYTATIDVTDPGAGNSPQQVTVTLSVVQPTMSAAPANLSFASLQGQSPPGQPLVLTNTGTGTLNWTAAAADPFLTISATSGSLTAGLSATLTVSSNSAALAPGTYTSSVVFTDPNASNSPFAVPVTVVVTPVGTIATSPTTLSFATPQGQNPLDQALALNNTGGGTLNWTASAADSWISLGPTSGSLAAAGTTNITVSVDATGLTPNTYTSSITLTDPTATNSPFTVPVTLVVAPAPTIGTNPTSLSFTTPQAQTPQDQALDLTNTGAATLNWTAVAADSWVSLNLSAGSLAAGQTDNLTVSIDVTGLAPNTYTSSITFTDPTATNSPYTVPVTLVVTPAASIGVSPDSLAYVTQVGMNPASQGLTVTNAGTGTLNWTGTTGAGWLSLSPTSGSLGAGQSVNATVAVDASGLAAGSYATWVILTDPAAANSPDTVPVTLVVEQAEPTASITQPANGSSFPVGATIQFTGTGTDVQDGTLSGGSLVWTYDVYGSFQGSIGTGGSVSKVATPLTTFGAGEYTIILTATDSDGNVSTSSIAITIVNNPNEAPVVQSGGTVVAKDDTSLTVDFTSSIDTRGAWTEVWVEYGTTPSLGSVGGRTVFQPGSGLTGIQWQPMGLQPFTRYYFRIVANGVGGQVQGPTQDVATTSPLVVTTGATLPNATVGVAYSVQLTATGGNPDASPQFVWSPGDALPPGLSLSSDGIISGTPTVSGTRTFAVIVSSIDALGLGNTGNKVLTLTIN